MKTILLKLISSHAPRIKIGLAGLIIAGITWVVGRIGFQTPAEWSTMIAGFAGSAAAYILEAVLAKLNANGVKEIQRILPQPLAEDGAVGPVTLAAVAEVVKAAEGPINGAFTPPPQGVSVPGN